MSASSNTHAPRGGVLVDVCIAAHSPLTHFSLGGLVWEDLDCADEHSAPETCAGDFGWARRVVVLGGVNIQCPLHMLKDACGCSLCSVGAVWVRVNQGYDPCLTLPGSVCVRTLSPVSTRHLLRLSMASTSLYPRLARILSPVGLVSTLSWSSVISWVRDSSSVSESPSVRSVVLEVAMPVHRGNEKGRGRGLKMDLSSK